MTPIETESGLNPQIQGTEPEANPSEGLLEPRLRDEILAGYLDYLGTKGYEHPHHYDLTDSVEGVLLDLFETPNLKSMLVSSSTARFLTRGINNRYWSFMRYLMS